MRAKTRAQLLSLFVKPGFASPVDVGIDPDFKNPDALFGVRRPGDARDAEPRILPRRQREDEGAPRRLSRLYRHHREACRTARRRSGRRPHHRARDRAVEGAVAGRRPPRHRQDLQPDDAARSSPSSRRSSTGTRRSPRRVSAAPRRSSSPSRRRLPARARSSLRRRCRRGRNGSRSASSPIMRACFRRRSTTPASLSIRRS